MAEHKLIHEKVILSVIILSDVNRM